jgi:hypothetical protein
VCQQLIMLSMLSTSAVFFRHSHSVPRSRLEDPACSTRCEDRRSWTQDRRNSCNDRPSMLCSIVLPEGH